MKKITVELVRYDTEKTKKRKRANFTVETKTEEAIIEKLERIHKGDKILTIHEIIWGESEVVDVVNHKKFTGTVKFFDDVKGFGFIRPDEDRDDLWFHASALGEDTVYDDDPVEFEITRSPKGEVAVRVKALLDVSEQ